MSNLTVILPAAGKGTRLNLPYPKEILRLDQDHALIDNCFNFFRDYGRKDVEFVVVINENDTIAFQFILVLNFIAFNCLYKCFHLLGINVRINTVS